MWDHDGSDQCDKNLSKRTIHGNHDDPRKRIDESGVYHNRLPETYGPKLHWFRFVHSFWLRKSLGLTRRIPRSPTRFLAMGPGWVEIFDSTHDRHLLTPIIKTLDSIRLESEVISCVSSLIKLIMAWDLLRRAIHRLRGISAEIGGFLVKQISLQYNSNHEWW